VSLFVPSEDIVMPYSAANVYSSERVTHVMRKSELEITNLQAAGVYRADVVLGTPYREVDEIREAKDEATGFSDINDEGYTLYEMQVSMVLKGCECDADMDKPRPYVITKIKGGEMPSIRRNWSRTTRCTCAVSTSCSTTTSPASAPTATTFHLIGGYARQRSILRQLVDAGTLSNLPGGLKTRDFASRATTRPSARVSGATGRDVGCAEGQPAAAAVQGAQSVLAGLLDKIIEDGRRLPGTADMKISDMSAQTPVGTTLACLSASSRSCPRSKPEPTTPSSRS
jgi:hypothetical protein